MCEVPQDWFGGAQVLVVGGTSGIGAGIAAGFAAAGAHVTVTGATEGEVAAAQGQGLAARVLDVTDADAVTALAGALGAVDHVVVCAGVIRRGAEHDPAVFAEVLDINLTGAMRVAAAFRPALAKAQGTLTLTASMLSFFGGGLVPGYAASKGGVAQLAKSLAIAWAAEGIRVNAVAPGWIATPLTDALRDDPARAGTILARTPMGRVLFLASPLAAFVTGVVLPVDGGYLIA
jgi:NAD(P)-dependent dehydrogenase (short-subunit alcohol dehydrogenase family)